MSPNICGKLSVLITTTQEVDFLFRCANGQNLLVFAVKLHIFVGNVDKFTCKREIFIVFLMK
jgi:hypothetical protein